MKILMLKTYDKLNNIYDTFIIGYYENYASIERILHDYEIYLYNHTGNSIILFNILIIIIFTIINTMVKHDDYMTPDYAWDNIQHIIPKGKQIWEAFYGDGASGNWFKKKGFDVIHKPVDFFDNNYGEIIVTNPPFSKSKEVLSRLVDLGKPFIVILPTQKITTQYVRNLFKDQTDKLQIIVPRSRIHFKKLIDGKAPDNWKSACYFDCFYYCWKINLERDIVWLD